MKLSENMFGALVLCLIVTLFLIGPWVTGGAYWHFFEEVPWHVSFQQNAVDLWYDGFALTVFVLASIWAMLMLAVSLTALIYHVLTTTIPGIKVFIREHL